MPDYGQASQATYPIPNLGTVASPNYPDAPAPRDEGELKILTRQLDGLLNVLEIELTNAHGALNRLTGAGPNKPGEAAISGPRPVPSGHLDALRQQSNFLESLLSRLVDLNGRLNKAL